jgi:hypothetical protein
MANDQLKKKIEEFNQEMGNLHTIQVDLFAANGQLRKLSDQNTALRRALKAVL